MKNINKILSTLSLSASDTREDTIKSIIRTTLQESKIPINLSELKENIDVIYEITLYDVEFNTLLKTLIDDGEIILNNSLYSLADAEKIKLVEIEANLKSNEVIRFQNFKEFIIEKSPVKIDESDIKLLWNVLKDYLYGCFYQYGIKAIEYLYPQFSKSDGNNFQNGEIFNDCAKKLCNQELTNIFKIAVDLFPDYATKEDLDFIDELGQKTLSFASLGLSPEQAHEDLDKELIDWTLFLDTNFLFSILGLHANVENESSRELIKLVVLNKDIIKIKFRYSELTLKELRHKKDDFSSLDESLTDSSIRAILSSGDLDEFARKYYSDLLINRDETLHPVKIIDLAEITLPKEGILISRNQKQIDSLDEKFIGERIVEYQRYINEINELRTDFSKKNHTYFRPYFRSDSQITHDVILRELILSSRRLFKKDEVKTFNEVKYFGLTLDELLIRFDSHKIKSVESAKYPTFFRPSFLLNKLVKLLPIKTPDYKKAFIKAVSTRGFHKDSQKSNDIIKVATYLKKFGIDNESVLLNLVSEKLFMDKFHQESSKADFDSEKFFESELNKIFTEQEKEVLESKEEVAKLSEQTANEKAEKLRLKELNDQKEKDATLLHSAIDQLRKQIKKLEQRPTINIVSPSINFEEGERKLELDKAKEELRREREKNINLLNLNLKASREKYIYWKIFWWRFKSFIWILILPLLFLLIYFLLKDSQYFPNEPVEKSLNFFLKTDLVKGILVVVTILYQAIFISIFSSKFFQTNKSKFVECLYMPDDLKEKVLNEF
jgi:hypothetical protein